MYSRNRKNNDYLKILKDYAVPLVWLFLILFLLFNVFSSDNKSEVKVNNNVENNLSGVKISLVTEDTKAFITYKNEKKVELSDDIILGKWEKVSVEQWKLLIVSPLKLKMTLWKAGELEYKEDWSFMLNSGNLWIEAMQDTTIYTKYANVILGASSISNISQNAVETAIYSIDWNIWVSTIYWIETKLASWKKITIKAKQTNSSEFDPKKSIVDIDDYFKLSDWYKDNWWDLIMKNIDDSSSETSSWKIMQHDFKKLNDLIAFDNLQDEFYSVESKLNLTWRYDALKIWEITINNNKAKLDSIKWNFQINLNLENKINDLVIKVFDTNKNLISKKVITIYLKSANNKVGKIQSNVENYKVDASKFYIYEPTKTGKITTTSSQITIRWKVLDKNIKNVSVNGYRLKSFNGSTWRYHAFVNQWTLKDWANIYEIKYLDKDWKVVYKEYYNIYKKIKTVKKISGEAKIKKS